MHDVNTELMAEIERLTKTPPEAPGVFIPQELYSDLVESKATLDRLVLSGDGTDGPVLEEPVVVEGTVQDLLGLTDEEAERIEEYLEAGELPRQGDKY
jgi:hypothetical protein